MKLHLPLRLRSALSALAALAAAALTLPTHADYVWKGGTTITQELWQAESSWELTESSVWNAGGTGPGSPSSDMWDKMVIENAAGEIGTLEGWAVKLALTNSTLTVGLLKKFQGGCTVDIDARSVLTVSNFPGYGNGGGNDGGVATINNLGTFNLVLNKNTGGDGFTFNLGQTGIVNVTKYDATARTMKLSALNAELDGTLASGPVYKLLTRDLVTLGEGTSFEGAPTITITGEGYTKVEAEADLGLGKYLVTNNATGVSLTYGAAVSDTLDLGAGQTEVTVDVSGYILASGNLTAKTTAKTATDAGSAGKMTLTGAVSTGSHRLVADGIGELVLEDSTGVGKLQVNAGCTVELAGAGALAGESELFLHGGTVKGQLGGVGDKVQIHVDATAGTAGSPNAVNLSGLTGDATCTYAGIAIGADARLLTASGTSIETGADNILSVTPTSQTWGTAATAGTGQYTIISGAALTVGEGSLALSGALADWMGPVAGGSDDGVRYIYLTDQTLTLGTASLAIFTQEMQASLGTKLDAVEAVGGALKLTIKNVDTYLVTGQGGDGDLAGYDALGNYNYVSVASGQQLSISLPGAPSEGSQGFALGNLDGGEGSSVVVSNTDAAQGTALINLKNTADSNFAGGITATEGPVDVVKTGAGKLTVGGVVKVAGLEMQEGTLLLDAAGNDVGTITLAGSAAGATQLEVTEDLSVRSLEDSAAGSGTIKLADGAELTVDGGTASVLDNGVIDGTGLLKLSGAGISFTSATAAQLKGAAVEFVAPATLALGAAAGNTVASLDGTGVLSGGAVAVSGTKGASFSGELAGTHVTVNAGAAQDFGPVSGTGRLTLAGTSSLDFAGGTQLEALTLQSTSVTTFLCQNLTLASVSNPAAQSEGAGTDVGEMTVEQGAAITISSEGGAIVHGGEVVLGTATGDIGTLAPTLVGSTFSRLDQGAAQLFVRDGQLVLVLQGATQNAFAAVADNAASAAGAALLWEQERSMLAAGGDLAAVWDEVDALIQGGRTEAANEALAAVAGASTATIGAAFSADMERQLRAIRNRTTSMGVVQDVWNEELPYFNAWINGEGDYRKVDADGYLPGYELTSWGGTVGFDVDCTNHLTAGLAFTAMYGDLETESADLAEGDFDTYYASAFARVSSGAWVHSFVGSFGLMSSTLDRTVNYGAGSYRTQGETDGVGFGFMYEVACTIPLDEEAGITLQPVANVVWRHVSVDAYEETGSDAGLSVGEQEYNALTFGLGARLQAVVDTNMFNRHSILELRALAKLDAGDLEGEAEVAMLQGGTPAKVNTAELGAAALELGLGLTVPIGEADSVFVDVSGEFRSGATHANAAAGYRVNF